MRRAASFHSSYKSVIRRRYHAVSQARGDPGIGCRQLVDRAEGAISLDGHDGKLKMR